MIDGEKQLIQNAIGGEASAFGLLYDRYQPQIYRFIYLKVSHREEAEDLCHQVFLNAWQNIKTYKHKGFPFSAWLYVIARNKVIDHYRQNKITIDIETVHLSIEDRTADMNDARQAITKLSSIEQDIVIMRFIEDLPIKEVAKNLNKNELTIRVMQNRAIKKLKRIMNNE